MSDNQFFKPTVLYKEYMILDMIEKNPNITQREMSKTIGIAVSMINDHIDQYEKDKLIKRKKHTTKTMEYFVTKKGSERKKVLNIGYLSSSQKLYNSAKENIERFLIQIEERDYKNIILYGAGEVAQILLNAIDSRNENHINIVALIDDDTSHHGTKLNNRTIIDRSQVGMYKHDGILISSYIHREKMFENLRMQNYDLTKVLNFFEI